MKSVPSVPSPASCPRNTLTVLYDGACPLCRREIALYRRLPANQPLAFVDVSNSATAVPPGTDRSRLLARFHVLRADGSLADGASGFVALWAALPGWRWLARLAALPGFTPLMELGYRISLHFKPAMQRAAAAFEPASLHVPGTCKATCAATTPVKPVPCGFTAACWPWRAMPACARSRSGTLLPSLNICA